MKLKVKELESFEIPRYVIFGPNALSKVNQVLEKLNLLNKRGLIISGKEHSKKFVNKLECNNCFFESISTDDVDLVIELFSKYSNKIDYVIGIGGGKVIDVSKAIAYILDIPFISIPTTSSHDGISSPYVSYILQKDLKERLGIDRVYKVPIAIIADTLAILNAPDKYFHAGIGELIGKLIAVKDWQLAHRVKGEDYSEYAANLALSSYEIILRNIEKLKKYSEESVRIVVKALISCGVAMAIAGSSRPCSGSEHLFSHALDILCKQYGLKPALHGEQIAIGSILMAYLHGLNWKKLKKILETLKVPTNIRQIGYDREIVIEALTLAHKTRPDRYTILGSDGITRKAAENAIEVTEID